MVFEEVWRVHTHTQPFFVGQICAQSFCNCAPSKPACLLSSMFFPSLSNDKRCFTVCLHTFPQCLFCPSDSPIARLLWWHFSPTHCCCVFLAATSQDMSIIPFPPFICIIFNWDFLLHRCVICTSSKLKYSSLIGVVIRRTRLNIGERGLLKH